MIRRKVFIIKGYSKTEQERSDDEYFVRAYSEYFQLNAGGAYSSKEVIYISEPSCRNLDKFMRKENLDYAIVVYIGHGGTKDDNQVFQLNSDEIIKPGQFMVKCKKQIIILESCRVIANEIPTIDLSDKIPMFAQGGVVRSPLSQKQSREVYDSHIKRCENGIMVCFACGLGDAAYNFIFSNATLQCSIDWHLDSSRHCAILPMDELMRLAWIETFLIASEKYGINQLPHSINSMNFPFGVSKF